MLGPAPSYRVGHHPARGNLTAEKAGRVWVVEQAEAQRWAAAFQPYASLREPRKN